MPCGESVESIFPIDNKNLGLAFQIGALLRYKGPANVRNRPLYYREYPYHTITATFSRKGRSILRLYDITCQMHTQIRK